MKKIISGIAVIVICLLFLISIIYVKSMGEETEIINADVSANDIKCILKVESVADESIFQIPIGYRDGRIYFLKYNDKIKQYDGSIYTLNSYGNEEKLKFKLSSDKCKGKLSILGENIFFGNGYMNFQNGKEKILFDDIKYDNCYCVSGNDDFVLFEKNQNNERQYLLYNLEDSKQYKFSCKENDINNISNIVYDEVNKKFYALCMNNTIKIVTFKSSEFVLEDYCELNENHADLKLSEFGYIFESQGQLYFEDNKKDNGQAGIKKFNIHNSYLEKIENISLCSYDNYHREYVLLEKSDMKDSKKLYFSKFQADGFEMIMEVPKSDDEESSLSIHMLDTDNVLIHEEIHDKKTKKIKNIYKVYDLIKYFEQNDSEQKNNEVWNYESQINLNNTFKNINKYDEGNSQNKNVYEPNIESDVNVKTNDENKNIDNTAIENINNNDYRENNASWLQSNGNWYYHNDEDKLVTGWVHTPKGWYYFYEDGTMQKNTIVRENGEEYYLGEDGLLVNSQDDIKENVDKYYDEDKNAEIELDDRQESKKDTEEDETDYDEELQSNDTKENGIDEVNNDKNKEK